MRHPLLLALALAGCTSAPMAPRVAVMPAPGKSFDHFAAEERSCRHYAEQSIGADDAATRSFVGSTAAGTAIGAVAGAAVGGREGAATGAAAGLITGAAVGSGQSGWAARDQQRRYDIAYEQCMYAKGNQVPGYYRPAPAPPPTRPADYPPPPPDGRR